MFAVRALACSRDSSCISLYTQAHAHVSHTHTHIHAHTRTSRHICTDIQRTPTHLSTTPLQRSRACRSSACLCSLLPARMGRGYRRDELCPESVCVSECLCSLLPARMSRGYRRDEMRPVCVCVNVLFSSTRTCGQRVQA